MRGLERIGQRDAGVGKGREVERSADQPLLQCLPLQSLHHQEDLTVRRFADVEDGADVRMLQRGHGARLALEPFARRRRIRECRRQHLDRDVTLESGVARPVHLAHPARADLVDYGIGSQTDAGRQGHEE